MKDEKERIQILRDYVAYCVERKEVRVAKFHRAFKPYSRKQSTIDLVKKAIKRNIIFPPRLLCLQDTSTRLISYENVPLIDSYEEKKSDPDVYLVMALAGAYSLMYFKRGEKNLTFTTCIYPSYPARISFDQIDPTAYKKGALPELQKPQKWDALDWKIYKERNDPTRSSVKIGQKLGISYDTVLTRYKKILKECQIWMPFFPRGYYQYVPYVLMMKTAYEIGLINELKKLDRSSYVYKVDDTLILTLFFDSRLEIESFLQLEKKRAIHDLRVSFPLRTYNEFW